MAGKQPVGDCIEWLGSLDVAPGGGESFRIVEERVLAALDRVLTAHAGKTIAIVSHVTPIKTLVAHALEAPLLSGVEVVVESRSEDHRENLLARLRESGYEVEELN